MNFKRLNETDCKTCLNDSRTFRATLVVKKNMLNRLSFSKRWEMSLVFKCTSQHVQSKALQNESKLKITRFAYSAS
jgi:hypothetical protein